MADVKAIYAGVGAYVLYMLTLEYGVLPNEVVLITELMPTVREDLRTHDSQVILGNLCEKGSQGHVSLTLFNGSRVVGDAGNGYRIRGRVSS